MLEIQITTASLGSGAAYYFLSEVIPRFIDFFYSIGFDCVGLVPFAVFSFKLASF